MITDRTFSLSLTVAFAWFLWAVVVVGITLGVVHELEWLRDVALTTAAAAATVHVRSFMCVFSQRMKASFELGREVERQHQRELRSV